MKPLSLTVAFLACLAAVIEHRALHISSDGQGWLTIAAVVAFLCMLEVCTTHDKKD